MSHDAQRRRLAVALGVAAEQAVADALTDDGWRVLARNWMGAGAELDLVVAREGRLRFVEVKARAPGDPVGLDAVDGRKRRRLIRAAEAFLADYHDLMEEACFLVALVEDGQITWVDDAFDG